MFLSLLYNYYSLILSCSEQCPILSQSDVSLLRTVCRAARSIYFLKGMSVIETSDVIANMYFVDFGGVTVREPRDDMSTIVKLSRGR